MSDKIVTTFTTTASDPGFTWLSFLLTSGLDMTGVPITCVSVGGCQLTYDGSVQTIGSIQWAAGIMTPSPGTNTTLEFQSLTGTRLTTTLVDFAGGSSADPILAGSGEPVGQITGTIGAYGTQDYYSFYWPGGFFSATASIGGTPDTSASYLFSEGAGGACTSGQSVALNSGDNFSGTIAIGNLAAGQYCTGLAANNPADPGFTLTFNTPVTSTSPEPSSFLLVACVAGMARISRMRRRGI